MERVYAALREKAGTENGEKLSFELTGPEKIGVLGDMKWCGL